MYILRGSPQFGHLFLLAPPEVHLKLLCIGPMVCPRRSDSHSAVFLYGC